MRQTDRTFAGIVNVDDNHAIRAYNQTFSSTHNIPWSSASSRPKAMPSGATICYPIIYYYGDSTSNRTQINSMVLMGLKLIPADADPFPADGGNYEFSQIYYLSKNRCFAFCFRHLPKKFERPSADRSTILALK